MPTQQKINSNNLKTINGISLIGSGSINITTFPAGLDGQIQFNNNGSFGASSNLTFGSGTLFVGDGITDTKLRVRGNQPFMIGMQNTTAGTYAWMGVETNGDYRFSNEFGTTLVLFKQNSNVGINNLNPLARLDVVNSSASQPIVKLTQASSQSADSWQLLNNSGTVLTKFDNNGNLKITSNSNPNIKLFATSTNNINGRIAWGADSSVNDSVRILAIDQGFNSVASLAIDVSTNANNPISSSDRNILFSFDSTTIYKKLYVIAKNLTVGNDTLNAGYYITGNETTSKLGLLSRPYGFFNRGDLALCVRTITDTNPATFSDARLYIDGTSGNVAINSLTALAQLDIINSNASQPALKITGASSQSANLWELYKLGGSSPISWFTNTGNFVVKGNPSTAETIFAIQRAGSTSNFFEVVNSISDSATTVITDGTNTSRIAVGDEVSINVGQASNVSIHTSTAKGVGNLQIGSRTTIFNANAGGFAIADFCLATSQTVDFIRIRNQANNATISVLAKADGSYQPASLSDSLVTNNSFYYSTTQSQIAYKTPSGSITIPINKLGDSNVGSLVFNAGGISAGTAPLKLTTQALPLTAPEQGSFELVGNSLQFTQLVKRRGVAMGQNVRTSSTVISNSTLESSSLIQSEHGANYLEVGKCEEIVLRGVIQQTNSGSGQLQIRIKYGGITVQTISTVTGNIAAGTPFVLEVSTTCRSTGVNGSMQFDSMLRIDGQNNVPDGATLVTIDTTTTQNTSVTAQWTVANQNNSLTINQGRVLCIDTNK